MIVFRVIGKPIGQPRPRAARFGNSARVYDDPKHAVHSWRELVALAAQQNRPPNSLDGPVSVEMVFWMPRPKAHYKRGGDLKPTAPVFCTSKPDSDNLAKAVLDTLTACQYWLDDSQVTEMVVRKHYVLENPSGVLVKIAPHAIEGRIP